MHVVDVVCVCARQRVMNFAKQRINRASEIVRLAQRCSWIQLREQSSRYVGGVADSCDKSVREHFTTSSRETEARSTNVSWFLAATKVGTSASADGRNPVRWKTITTEEEAVDTSIEEFYQD